MLGFFNGGEAGDKLWNLIGLTGVCMGINRFVNGIELRQIDCCALFLLGWGGGMPTERKALKALGHG
jgi:hypothetical protein